MKVSSDSYLNGYVLTAIFLCSLVFSGQGVSASAVSCDSLGLRAISGTLLQRYYTASGTVGGRGCWVHPHPNHMDFVITPFSWGREPNPAKSMLISNTMLGIANARSTYSRLGGVHNMPSYYLLNDVHDSASIEWPIAGNCWIVAGPHGGEGSWREPGSPAYKQQVAHEVGHCFIMENVANYTATSYAAGNARWWDESAAEYLSALVYPSMNGEHQYALAFDLDGRNFMQAYSAFLLLEAYVARHGLTSLLPLLNELHQAKNEAEVLSVFTRNNRDRLLHDFYVHHFQNALQDAGCRGSGRPCMYPREANVLPLQETVLASGDARSITLPALPGATLALIYVTIPKGMNVNMGAIRADVANVYGLHGTLLDNGVTSDLARANLLAGACEGDRKVSLLITHLKPQKMSGVTIPYALHAIECGPDTGEAEATRNQLAGVVCTPQTAQRTGMCVTGNWAADAGQLKAQMSALLGLEVDEIKGSVIMSICAGGTGHFSLNHFTVKTKPGDAGVLTMALAGASDFEWQANGGKFVGKSGIFTIDASATMQMGAIEIPLPDIPLRSNQFPVGTADGQYQCSDSSLTFSGMPEEAVIKSWARSP